MFARPRWTPPMDRSVRNDARQVLDASEALLRSFQSRRVMYHQWEEQADALLSELNRDLPVDRRGGDLGR